MVAKSMMAGAALVALAAGGCAQTSTVVPATVSSQYGAVEPAFAVSGIYKGTIVEQEGTSSRSGTVAITIHETAKKISGSFDVTFSGKTDDLTISGAVKSQKKTKARIAFEISDPNGRYAAASATVGKKRLRGKATVPASGGKPAVHLTFTTKRTK